MRNPFVRRHPFGEEELSTYLDGRLPAAEAARLEEHLVSCQSCRERLGELRAVVERLRALPPVPAPRSFALRPEQIRAPSRPATWAFGPAGAAAASLLLFLVLVGMDLGTLGGGDTSEEMALPMAAEEAPEDGGALMGAAPAPTPAPAPAERASADEEKESGVPEAAEDAAVPAAPPGPAEPPLGAEDGDGAGRWVLRGFQGAAGAAFLAALAALLWRRRTGRAAGRT